MQSLAEKYLTSDTSESAENTATDDEPVKVMVFFLVTLFEFLLKLLSIRNGLLKVK